MSVRELDVATDPVVPLLEASWVTRKPGLLGWFTEVHHTEIGKRYIVTAMIFFVIAGLEALLMRIQLSRPENRFLNPDLYNQVFSMHGTTMMFLFAVPIMEGMGVYLVPLLIGTRNIAFPRLNAFGYYIYLFGGIFLYLGFITNTGPDVGWFAYTPLSGPQFSPGKRADFWAQMITYTEISALTVAVELIVTILRQRAPGMTLNRMPMFVWAMFVQSFMVIFAMPSVMASSGMLLLDRTIGTHFFNPAEGGSPLLWQHLFWFFGHPEVYIIFIPATGFVSHLVEPFCKRHNFGYIVLVLSLVVTGFIGFGLWVHHMFTTGLPQMGETFFTAASLMIVIPSGAQIFCWLATMWLGRPRLSVPFMYVIGFILTFVIGGLTGVMVASVPFDLQAHDTFFIVAHFHYVLIGGAVFPLLGALYYWFPKMTGRLQNDRLGHLTFWLVFIGFHATFFPMHFLGLMGMPRRVYTYRPEMGWAPLNVVATVGAFIIAIGVLLFVINAASSVHAGKIAGPNPWGAATLEWATSSPPPPYNFNWVPIVDSRTPLWSLNPLGRVVGLPADRMDVLITTFMDATPTHRYLLPGPTIWPFLLAVAAGLGLGGSVFNMWYGFWGALLCAIPLIGWFWPRGHVNDLLVKGASK